MIKLKAVSDNFGQFWTVMDKMLWYNSSVKDDGSGLSFNDELFAFSMVFAGYRAVRLERDAYYAREIACSFLPSANRP